MINILFPYGEEVLADFQICISVTLVLDVSKCANTLDSQNGQTANAVRFFRVHTLFENKLLGYLVFLGHLGHLEFCTFFRMFFSLHQEKMKKF